MSTELARVEKQIGQAQAALDVENWIRLMRWKANYYEWGSPDCPSRPKAIIVGRFIYDALVAHLMDTSFWGPLTVDGLKFYGIPIKSGE